MVTEPLAAVLRVRDLSLGFGRQRVLHDLSFDVPARGVTLVLGPAGVGKSTLIRTLARRSELLPSFWWTGTVLLGERHLLREIEAHEARRAVPLLAQKARLYTASVADNLVAAIGGPPLTLSEKRARAEAVMERAGLAGELTARLHAPAVSLSLGLQRRLSLARLAAGEPAVILVDEPTRDIPEDEALALAEMLREEGRRRAVLLITHDQRVARRIGDRVVLLVAGHVAAQAPVPAFFDAPPNELARRFVVEGNCWTTEESPRDDPAGAAPAPPPATEPSGFRWVVPGVLGGMARPGLLNDETDDLAALRALGVHTLVSLEQIPFPADRLAAYGIAAEHLPIADMCAPDLAAALAVCSRTVRRMAERRPTVYHCRAGVGRTGCLLASTLVCGGYDALHALEEVRTVSPLYVQSDVQVEFLHAVERGRRQP